MGYKSLLHLVCVSNTATNIFNVKKDEEKADFASELIKKKNQKFKCYYRVKPLFYSLCSFVSLQFTFFPTFPCFHPHLWLHLHLSICIFCFSSPISFSLCLKIVKCSLLILKSAYQRTTICINIMTTQE